MPYSKTGWRELINNHLSVRNVWQATPQQMLPERAISLPEFLRRRTYAVYQGGVA
jgi:hypothetical protein